MPSRIDILLGALALLGVAQPLAAQPPKTEIPPPSPPFIAAPPEFSSWSIVSAPQSGGSGTTTTAVHTREIEWFQAGNREIWYSNNTSLMPADNDASKIVLMAPPGAGPMPDGTIGPLNNGPGFPGFWWLDLANYKGVEKINGRPCHHFRLEPPPSPPPSAPAGPPVKKTIGGREFVVEERPSAPRSKPLVAEAWIDVETKLPAAILAEGRLHTYTFLAPPASMLSLPANMSDALKLQKSRAERLQKLKKKFSQ